MSENNLSKVYYISNHLQIYTNFIFTNLQYLDIKFKILVHNMLIYCLFIRMLKKAMHHCLPGVPSGTVTQRQPSQPIILSLPLSLLISLLLLQFHRPQLRTMLLVSGTAKFQWHHLHLLPLFTAFRTLVSSQPALIGDERDEGFHARVPGEDGCSDCISEEGPC